MEKSRINDNWRKRKRNATRVKKWKLNQRNYIWRRSSQTMGRKYAWFCTRGCNDIQNQQMGWWCSNLYF